MKTPAPIPTVPIYVMSVAMCMMGASQLHGFVGGFWPTVHGTFGVVMFYLGGFLLGVAFSRDRK